MKLFQKILIANRGEIAIRIASTARKLGIATAAIYSEHDKHALHTKATDEAWDLGPGDLASTYLNIPLIIKIAHTAGCDAIHPGYGFLSENPAFAQACKDAGIQFIGPSASVILAMGNKIAARDLAKKAGLPVGEGITGSPEELLEQAHNLPYPVLIKAAAGGGGKGMRIVRKSDELKDLLETTSREAASYFGDGSVYIERFVEEPRHIEVQILGDNYGNVVHFYERECSIQRRYQKIIEESPSPTLNHEVRESICKAAVDLAASIGYSGAGTIEFLVDKDLNFFFLEMNTRIQVEHPVTELVTKVDLVEEQILIAAGHELRFKQAQITQYGHAIECRIYAEDPENNFMPSPGTMLLFQAPSGRDIRLDTAYNEAGIVSSAYDPMISKLITWGHERSLAIARMAAALNQFAILGIKTNVPYLTAIMRHEAYLQNQLSTKFCDHYTQDLNQWMRIGREKTGQLVPTMAYLFHSLTTNASKTNPNTWEQIGYWRNFGQITVQIDGKQQLIESLKLQGEQLAFEMEGVQYACTLLEKTENRVVFSTNGHSYSCLAHNDGKGHTLMIMNGITHDCWRSDLLTTPDVFSIDNSKSSASSGNITSPMPGKVIKVNVIEGQAVEKGSVLLVVESMKMENNILAPLAGKVVGISIKPGMMTDTETILMKIE
jgi:acetyl-CoA carboxylase biotin carboxylase subunit